MTTIRLHNTRTRTKEVFAPLDPANVRMYVCGPTVYDRAHLGNARPVVVFDVLFRLLRHVYGEGHVTYVRNFTDVDDKINARAAEMKAAGDERPLEAIIRGLTDETIGWYHADMDALGALRPTHEPRATEWIGAMIGMIEDLIAKGHAYAKDGHVVFRVSSYKDYGRLSGRSVDDMIAGARVEVAPFKEDPMDFVLWKPSSPELPGWESPWGRGRPGWHIECSAMAHELLGATFDIHAGGIDLQFPHHENEIAQSMCAQPEGGFAKVWLHNELLQVEGKKMSKSLGNFFTVRDLLEGNWSGGWKVPGEVIRFVFLQTHYSKPMDWTEEKARQAKATLARWFRMIDGVEPNPYGQHSVVPFLANDLNSSEVLTRLNALADAGSANQLAWALDFLGLRPTSDWYRVHREEFAADEVSVGVSWSGSLRPEDVKAAQRFTSAYAKARKRRDFSLADKLRENAAAAGLKLVVFPGRDAHGEISDLFDPEKLKALE